MALLTLEIVTPLGTFLERDDVEEVVVRRREPVHDPGSEVGIFPRHSPLLLSSAAHVLRYRRGGRIHRVRVEAGFVEVYGDRVTAMVPRAERVGGKN
jgi:F0F1-type ATP synthase epsilon subunit